ncbi:cyclic pyranopterin monophosphate synthase MoaC [Parasporobacterium paucivorans]|uniref:Cyclic pyranopterin monophosphate synthase n=1 Tax=Parasporobacterium paucivorans DSM 15970 TaxID=1122934 RepID=A0A1M6E673_9FIRM|nr:cyclic pyranopterin monophosphate synthase MoaC [Parasporobacterium paucivorans]SHI81044.1 cyclic pyranopterin phosphate synthase [Parasporobacterium paucivorans DSM 15970]
MEGLTHFNKEGRATMVDVSDKAITTRTATACATVKLNENTYKLVREGKMKKGDVLAVAQVAGIMAAKKTPDIIPMCHPIALTKVDISYEMDDEKSTIYIESTTKCKGETGVEMEALTAASACALTIYDMCKAIQRDIEISDIHLLTKSGGKSGDYNYKGE